MLSLLFPVPSLFLFLSSYFVHVKMEERDSLATEKIAALMKQVNEKDSVISKLEGERKEVETRAAAAAVSAKVVVVVVVCD